MFRQLPLALLAWTAHAKTPWHKVNTDYTFENYLSEFHKWYSPHDYAVHEDLFNQKRAEIIEHNSGSASWKKGVNHLTDLSPEERSQFTGLNAPLLHQDRRKLKKETTHVSTKKPSELAASLDWRTKGMVTPVKNQGVCGSCWAFATAETIESHWAINTGELQELSEQFILDCTPNPNHCGGNGGCEGGTGELALARLIELGGIPSEWTYPYLSGGNGTASVCHGLPLEPEHAHSGDVMAAATFTDFKVTKTNDYDSMMDAIQLGPMAISVDADTWHDYETGVFTGGNMKNPDLDHLVQLVGYGSDNGDDYWLVRNSWTPLWGESGYIRLKRYGSGKEPCGLDITPADGNGCDDGPPTVEVCGQCGVLYGGVYPVVEPTK